MSVVTFQDDLVLVVSGRRAALLAEKQISTIIEQLGIQLSDKANANKAFNRMFQALGATFDLRGLHPTMLHKPATIQKFKRLLKAMEANKGKLV